MAERIENLEEELDDKYPISQSTVNHAVKRDIEMLIKDLISHEDKLLALDNRYKVNNEWVDSVEKHFKDLNLKLFMGTWCEDSEREVPAIFKLLDAVNFDQNKIDIYAMSEEKTTSENFEKGLNIIKVPTLIFYKDGKELNRFVEFSIVSLKEDIRKIVSGEEYLDAYYSQ